ncbi:MAG: aminotransferase class I/II-fold pyridoxal phosphate-dependent enzyme [Candidatus Krumholzibacteria bacterium]|nr:aminotransferase class I/II-fold pyridoxal phosphate-dependent enzyme [Candidatus Krumholzibacteria bacterium]
MPAPRLSRHFASRQPSVIRLAQIEFAKRQDSTQDVNVAIGNVSLPMHPAMQARLGALTAPGTPFADGVVKYSATVGLAETNDAFLNIIASSGCKTDSLHCQVTDGGSQGMELVIVGCCGAAGTTEQPLLLIDAAYTNYTAFAERVGRETVSITRTMDEEGHFSLPSEAEIEATIIKHRPGAMVIIPYDNPTGQLYERAALVKLARLCVEHNLWIISDEAYRELYYTDDEPVSVWSLTEEDVPGITGRRISIETSSKVWNACGLRIGGLVTDNAEFHARAVAENTAGLCSNVIGQYIFGSLAHESHADLQAWYNQQREYYRAMLQDFTTRSRDLMPGLIVSSPDASIYSVVDVRNIAPADFDALDFVLFCAQQGAVQIDGQAMTLLTAPMSGFYKTETGALNPGRTQMRVAYVDTPERMKLVPELLAGLFAQYLDR